MQAVLRFFTTTAPVPLWKALIVWATGALFGYCIAMEVMQR